MRSYRMIYSVPDLYDYSQNPGELELQQEFSAKSDKDAKVCADRKIDHLNQYSRGVHCHLEDLFRIDRKEVKKLILSKRIKDG